MKTNRTYKTVSLYFSESSLEDQMILNALILQNKVGTSMSGIIKQILYKTLVEQKSQNEDKGFLDQNEKNKKSAKELNKIFGMEEM